MTSFAAFAARMAKAPARLKATEAEMVRAAALAVTAAERESLSRVTGGTNRLRGVGRSGAKLGVGFDVKGTQKPTALVAARGPWHLIEYPSAGHDIPRRRRRGAKRALAGPNFGPVARVHHPGVKRPHQPWAKGLEVGVPVGAAAARAAGIAGAAKVFVGG